MSQKIGAVVAAIVMWVVTSVLILFGLSDVLPTITLAIIFIVSPLLCILFAVNMWRKFDRYEKQNYHWYIQTHPESFRQNRVYCHSCNSGKVHTRNLFNRTFTREHFCSQCGTTLYFSPES